MCSYIDFLLLLKNYRLNLEVLGGAWCPKNHVSENDFTQYIQVRIQCVFFARVQHAMKFKQWELDSIHFCFFHGVQKTEITSIKSYDKKLSESEYLCWKNHWMCLKPVGLQGENVPFLPPLIIRICRDLILTDPTRDPRINVSQFTP